MCITDAALGYLSPANYESKHPNVSDLSVERGLTTVRVCVACATPPVDNPVSAHTEMAENLSP